MSHTSLVDARSNLATDIRLAMTEAAEQGCTVSFPAVKADKNIRRAQEALARRENSISVVTVPLANDGQIIGALTLQRERGGAFDAGTVDTLEALATVVGPLLDLKRRDARTPLRHAAGSTARLAARVIGSRHTGKKFAALALASLLVWMSTANGTYRVTASARLEGEVQRAVVAEGVETAEQLDVLRDANCDELQGYLYSSPVTAAEAEVLLRGGGHVLGSRSAAG